MNSLITFPAIQLRACGHWSIGFLSGLALATPAIAQPAIVPDTTLGTEASAVTYDADTYHITAGASRGPNLFHSFDTFSIPTGEAAYFVTDSSAIAHIFARVTGSSPSDIHGTLGTRLQLPGELTSTDAALFLLNPHGLLFSDTATLDMAGAFYGLATAAIPFDGGVFSAVAPQSSTLLAIAPEVSFFNYLATASGPIHSTARLASPADLTLVGKTVVLQGELRAGQTLNVLARDRLTIQDSPTTAFIAEAGEEMGLHGNQGITIHALHHPNQVPFVSGGDLTLVSDGIISADAHFTVGGNFATRQPSGELADLQSPEDPIFEVVGDFSIGNYAGASLQVTAGNDITYGAVSIDAIDPAVNPNQPALILTAGGDITGTGEVVTTVATGALAVTLASEGDITVQGITTKGGNIDLRSQTAGIVSAGVLDTRDGSNDAGNITLNAAGDIATRERLDSSSATFSGAGSDGGKGGDIALASEFGTITIDAPWTASSFSTVGNAGAGGAITVVSDTGNIVSNAALTTSSTSVGGDAGAGGAIAFSSNSGDIDINADLFSPSTSTEGTSATGGAIEITSLSGDITINGSLAAFSTSTSNDADDRAGEGGAILVSSTAGDLEITERLIASSISTYGDTNNGGTITLSSDVGQITATNRLISTAVSTQGDTGNGGDIEISSVSGDITMLERLASYSLTEEGNAGAGGNIAVSSESGNISTDTVLTFSTAMAGNSGEGGDISLASKAGNISSGSLVAFSNAASGDAGDSGAVAIAADSGDIEIQSVLAFSFSEVGGSGQGGTVLLQAPNGAVSGDNAEILTVSLTEGAGETGPGGNVVLEANLLSGLAISTLSETENSGDLTIEGVNETLEISDLRLIAQGSISVVDPLIPSESIPLNLESAGPSGNTVITSAGDLHLTAVEIQSEARGPEAAGEVVLVSAGDMVFRQSQILSNTDGSGNGGAIRLDAKDLSLTEESLLATATTGAGAAGQLSLGVADTVTIDNSTVESRTAASSSGQSGSIDVMATEAVLTYAGKIAIVANGNGQAGNVALGAEGLTLNEGSQITTSTISSENGGNLILTLTDLLLLRNASLIATEAGTEETGSAGGNITLFSTFVITVPEENNDIIANAFDGSGGQIAIAAAAVSNFTERSGFTREELRALSTNDISASSQIEQPGSPDLDVLNVLDLDPTQQLEDLPGNFIREETLAPGSCIHHGNRTQGVSGTASFTEQSNLPRHPGEPTISTFETGTVRTETRGTPSSLPREPQGHQLLEPTGVFLLADGRWVLSHPCDRELSAPDMSTPQNR